MISSETLVSWRSCVVLWVVAMAAPELEVMDIRSNSSLVAACGAALAPAFRPPLGLPRLKQLRLMGMNLRDLDELVEALQHRPHASQPMEVIRLWNCTFDGAAMLGRALLEGRSLASLRELKIDSVGVGAHEWSPQLFEALAGGAGQQLEKIECRTDGLPVQAINRLLQGLAVRGACPRLHRLWLGNAHPADDGQLDAYSLGTILAGRAACSRTLRELLLRSCSLSNEGVRTVAAFLREPQAIQLEALELRAGEPDACEAVMELLSALGGRAGDRLRDLRMCLLEGKKDEVMRVVEHVVGIIKAGGLPAVQHCDGLEGITIYPFFGQSIRGANEVEQALVKRSHAQWLASW